MQGDAAPGEGEPRSRRGLTGAQAVQEPNVQSSVQQRRVDAEAPGLPRLLLGQRYLGVYLLAAAPGPGKPLEGRSVLEARLGQAVVEELGLERFRSLRRPGVERLRGDRQVGGENALGVLGPLRRLDALAAPLGARVDRDLAPALLVGGADRDLDLRRPLCGEDQGSSQGQLLHHPGPNPLRRRQGQLEEGGAGQQHGGADGMVCEPGVALQRDAPAEGEALALGVFDRRAQERVVEVLQAGGAKVPRPGGGVQPVASALEGVGGKRDRLGA